MTDRKLAANRANAQKSTGPKTPEGRAAVRLNGLKHGLTAANLVLDGESASEFEHLLDSLEAEHKPTTPTEAILVRQIAIAAWRLQRIQYMEVAYYRIRKGRLKETFKFYENLNDAGRHVVIALNDSTNILSNFSRYESRLERTMQRALLDLNRLRANRQAEIKNQTQAAPAPSQINEIEKPAPPHQPIQPTPIRPEIPDTARTPADMQ